MSYLVIIGKIVGRSLAVGVGLLATQAYAQSSSGTISVSLNVVASCAVNGGTSSPTMGNLGTIAFADQSGVFGSADASMVAQGTTSPVSILCTPGISPQMEIGAGANDAGNVRRLTMGQTMVAYRLYSDVARQNEITIGKQLSLGNATTTALSLPIYARVSSNGLALPAGTYTDTVQVTLSW